MNNEPEYAKARAEEFARRLRVTRERQGLTQRELGDRAGLSPAAISQLETGERRPNFTTLVHLARALGKTPDTLLGVAEEETTELKGLFRKLEGLGQDDINSVKAFVTLLKDQKKGKER